MRAPLIFFSRLDDDDGDEAQLLFLSLFRVSASVRLCVCVYKMCAATHLLIPRTFSSCLSLLSSLYSKREFVSLGCCCCKYMTQHSFYDCEKTIQSCGVHSTASSSGTLSAKCTGDENTVKCNSFVCVCKNTHTHTLTAAVVGREKISPLRLKPPRMGIDERTGGRTDAGTR